MSPVTSVVESTAAWFWGQAYDSLSHLSTPYTSVFVSQHRKLVDVGPATKPTDVLVSIFHVHTFTLLYPCFI